MPQLPLWNRIVEGDCIGELEKLPAEAVDLAFADPPFNIGYDYDVYQDRRDRDEYLAWSRRWIAAVHRTLKPTGTFWLAIGDEYAAELKLLSQEIGFHCRSWVIWYYTFGVNCKSKFSRSHAHLFYFVKDREQFTFRAEAPENRIPSARQLVYADVRANPQGRLPDDTWVLRPQDLAGCFSAEEDTWYFPRVAGTFKERAGFHGCQMPEQLLGRIIRFCSQPGEVVLDPFSGSATTLAVAKKLGRDYLGFDVSAEYVKRGTERLARINAGDPLVGAPEPTVSAPVTPPRNGAAKRPLTKRATQRAAGVSAKSQPQPSPPKSANKPGAKVRAAQKPRGKSVAASPSAGPVKAGPVKAGPVKSRPVKTEPGKAGTGQKKTAVPSPKKSAAATKKAASRPSAAAKGTAKTGRPGSAVNGAAPSKRRETGLAHRRLQQQQLFD